MANSRRKVKTTPFQEKNGNFPFNASGVARVGPRRFVFIDNKDPTAFFEMTFDADDVTVERIHRRRLAGVDHRTLGDPEGLARVDLNGDSCLIASSSLSSAGPHDSNDGLVRVRYRPDGDLPTEAMDGFRDWLLAHEPMLAASAAREPDAGGLNVEGLAWDPDNSALLFGLRGPAVPGRVAVVQVPVDPRGAPWTTALLGPPTVVYVRIPGSTAIQGIRDLSHDPGTGDFLLLLGRSTSQGKEPFQLCAWNRGNDRVELLDVTFHRTAKPEGVTAFSVDGHRRMLIVDDGGGYAVI